jgi:hypothetical protein
VSETPNRSPDPPRSANLIFAASFAVQPASSPLKQLTSPGAKRSIWNAPANSGVDGS